MTLNKITCINCLKNSRCFSNLESSDLARVRASKTQLHFNKGEIICKQGAYAANILYIYRGCAKNYLEANGGRNNLISILPEGEMIGLPSLFSGRIYPYSASALEECIICSFDINQFEDLIKTNGAFASAVIKCLNNSTVQSYDRYIFNKQRPLKGRLAEILLHLSEDIYRSREFKMSLSRGDIAEWTHMAPESVTRILSNFKKDNIIGIEGKKITLKDIQQLRQLRFLD